MSKKVDKIENKNIKTELRIGNVSVIHGEDAKKVKPENGTEFLKAWSLKEINGAKALYEQSYYSNSIVKLNTILTRYDTLANQELIYLYLGKGFEALNKNGQAIDAYQQLITLLSSHKPISVGDKKNIEQAQIAIKNLSK